MGESFISRRGGTGKAAGAISVEYPVGSSLTCTNGSKTIQTKDTIGKALFLVPEIGNWTLNLSNDAQNVTKSVTMTQNSAQSLKMSFEFLVFGDGTLNPDVGALVSINNNADGASSDWEVADGNLHISSGGSKGSGNDIYKAFSNAVTFGDKTKLKVTVQGEGTIGFANSNTTSFIKSVAVNSATETTLTIDISNYLGSYFLIFNCVGGMNWIRRHMYISRLWLE